MPLDATPRAGDVAQVRHRQYLIDEVVPPSGLTSEHTLVRLTCLDDDAQGRSLSVLWERELGARVIRPALAGLGTPGALDEPRRFAAYLHALKWSSVTATDPGFDVAAGYEVLREIETRRVASGWQPVGRKIGFTNRTIWPRYGVYLPMWAHVWAHTVRRAHDHRATLSLARLVQPRIESRGVGWLRQVVVEAGMRPVEWMHCAGFDAHTAQVRSRS